MLVSNTWGRYGSTGRRQWDPSGLKLDLGTCRRKILKLLPYLRFSLDLFPDCFAIATHNPSNCLGQAARRRDGAAIAGKKLWS